MAIFVNGRKGAFARIQQALIACAIYFTPSIIAGENDIIFTSSFEAIPVYSGLASLDIAGDPKSVKLADTLGLSWSLDLESYTCAQITAISPAGGVIWYLDELETWTETPACLASSIPSSSAGLPEAIAGRWFFQASFFDDLDEVIGSAVVYILASDIPFVQISQNRRYASMGDTIRAYATTAAGASIEDVDLYAILTRPDGSQQTIPGFSDKLVPVYSGQITDERYTLLGEEFEEDGEYWLRVDLVDANNSTIAMDESTFEICSVLTTVSGIVSNEIETPLGLNAAMAQVHAVSLNGEQYSSSIATDGSYTLSLPPGKYLISSIVVDDTGIYTTSGVVTEVDCSGTPIELDLVADSSEVASVPGNSSFENKARHIASMAHGLLDGLKDFEFISSAQASSPAAPDGMKKPNLLILFSNKIVDPEKQWIGNRAAEIIVSAARLESDDVIIRTDTDNLALINAQAMNALLGEGADFTEINDNFKGEQYIATLNVGYLGPYLDIAFSVRPKGSDKYISIGASSIQEVITPEITSPSQLAELGVNLLIPFGEEQVVNAVGTEGGPLNLFDVIRNHQKALRQNENRPIDPKQPVLSVAPDPAMVSENITAEMLMEDGDGTKLKNLNVNFDLERQLYDPDTKALLKSAASASDTTDNAGEVSVNFPASDPELRAGTGVVKASYAGFGLNLLAQQEYKVDSPENTDDTKVELDSPDMEVEPGETTAVDITVKDKLGSPKPDTEVVLSLAGVAGNVNANEAAAAGASLSRATVTTDSNGQAMVEFTAGTQGGAASVIGTVSEDIGSGELSVVYDTVDYLVGGNILVQVNALPGTIEAGSAAVIEVQLLRTFGPVDNGAVSLSIVGAGSLQDTEGFTDSEGKFSTIYTAPAQGFGSATIEVDLTVNATVYKGQTVVNYSTTGNIIEGNVIVNSQAQVDLLAGVTTINGYLFINGSDLLIYDLTPLSFLSSVKGLYIRSTLLIDLRGLERLTTIDGLLSIQNNALLNSLTGLNNLAQVNGDVVISKNKTLRTTAGLEMLHTVGTNTGHYLSISGSDVLQKITADLPALERIFGTLNAFQWVDQITLPALNRIGGLRVQGSDEPGKPGLRPAQLVLPALTNIDGFLEIHVISPTVGAIGITTGMQLISLPELTTTGSLRLEGSQGEFQGCNNYSCYRLNAGAASGSLQTINLPKLSNLSWYTDNVILRGFYGPITINLAPVPGPSLDLIIAGNKDLTFNLPASLPIGRYAQIYNNVGMGDDAFWNNWLDTWLNFTGQRFVGGNN